MKIDTLQLKNAGEIMLKHLTTMNIILDEIDCIRLEIRQQSGLGMENADYTLKHIQTAIELEKEYYSQILKVLEYVARAYDKTEKRVLNYNGSSNIQNNIAFIETAELQKLWIAYGGKDET